MGGPLIGVSPTAMLMLSPVHHRHIIAPEDYLLVV